MTAVSDSTKEGISATARETSTICRSIGDGNSFNRVGRQLSELRRRHRHEPSVGEDCGAYGATRMVQQPTTLVTEVDHHLQPGTAGLLGCLVGSAISFPVGLGSI